MQTIDDLIDFLLESQKENNITYLKKNYDEYMKGIIDATEDNINHCRKLKNNMEADDGWICVDKEFPKIEQNMLIIIKRENKGNGFLDTVTHWKKLPQPPKGEIK